MVGLLAEGTQARKRWIPLLKLSLQIGANGLGRGRIASTEVIDQNTERVALRAQRQVLLSRGPMIDAKAGADHLPSMEHAGAPSQSQSRIEVHVTGVVQGRVRGAGSRSDGAWARGYVE